MARQRKTNATPPPVPDAPDAEILAEASGVPVDELPEPEALILDEAPPHYEPETPIADPVPGPPPRQRSSFWPMILGGAFAAALGGGGTFALLRSSPELIGLPSTAGLDQQLSDHDKRLTDLAAALAALPEPTATAPEGPDPAELIGPVETRISELEATLKTLSDRLNALDKRPATAGAAPDLTAAAEAIKVAEASAQKLKDEAAALARQAKIAEALARIEGALESGQALAPGLDGLRQAGLDVPEALVAVEQGAPTLQALRDTFPEAAREAIALSLAAQPQDTTWGRISAFLQAQTGARSLSPRAGDDPDAILSRAEASLNANDLAAAIAAIAALPPEGQGRMQEWVTLASRRLAATEALAVLRAGGQP